MALQIWYPNNGARSFDRLFNRALRPKPVWSYAVSSPGQWPIPMDVVEDGDSVTVTATLPGVAPNDLSVIIEDGVLRICLAKLEAKKRKQVEVNVV